MRRVCADCPRWQVPPGRLARRCCIDGAITIGDHHCHVEAHESTARLVAADARPCAPAFASLRIVQQAGCRE